MADYYDDDLEYGSEQEFTEDALNDEEYEQLMETLPILKQKLSKYSKSESINEIDLKESLYNNYFNVDQTLDELKINYKLKGTYIHFSCCSKFYVFGLVIRWFAQFFIHYVQVSSIS